jgi:hypothetical protein
VASSKKELYERAQELDVPNRSQMSKDELIAAIRAASGVPTRGLRERRAARALGEGRAARARGRR